MITLRFDGKTNINYPDDVKRIQKIANKKGFEVPAADAQQAWEAHSEASSAGWLNLDSDDDTVWFYVKNYLTV